ncbi:MAG: hypothetical protein M3463_01085 [Verrucomicrobiota bacterium]|nr:hypothetical protein [Verrucomicrobiota bacterium]
MLALRAPWLFFIRRKGLSDDWEGSQIAHEVPPPLSDSPSVLLAVVATAAGELPAPTDLSATARSTSSIVLTWGGAAAEASEFRIERLDAGVWGEIWRQPIAETNYLDSGLSEETEYSYRVFQFNAAEESPASNVATTRTLRTGELQGLPAPPELVRVVRLDATRVKIEWSPWTAQDPSDAFTIMRAKDEDSWTPTVVNGAAYSEYIDENAPAGADYRYVAFVQGLRSPSGGPVTDVGGAPSDEIRIGHARATIKAGEWHAYHVNAFANPATGFVQAEKFIADDATEFPPPSPFRLDGPFRSVQILEEWNDWGTQYTEKLGFYPKGETLQVSARVESVHQPIYKTPILQVTPGDPGVWMMLPAGPTLVENDQTAVLTLNATLQVFDLSFEGNDFMGFDGRSHPQWQMVPLGRLVAERERQVTARVWPHPMGAFGSLITCLNAIEANPTVFNGPSTTFTLTSTVQSEPGEHYFLVNRMPGQLGMDVRAWTPIDVNIYLVTHIIGGQRFSVDGPDLDALRERLDSIYGEGANLWFNLSWGVGMEFNTDPGGDDTDEADQICALLTGEADKLRDRAALPGKDFSVFVFGYSPENPRYGYGVKRPPQPVEPKRDGAAVAADRYACVGSNDLTVIAHELGHLLNLDHVFEATNVAGNCKIPDDSDTRLMGYSDPLGRRLIKPERDIMYDAIEGLP